MQTLARVVLWTLIAVGALRGLLPAPVADRDAVVADGRDHRTAAAVAAAFMREYLTVGPDPEARAERLGRFTVAGLDLRRSVLIPPGVAQYADQVVASASRPVDGGVEVTVLAHVLQIRSQTYHDGGTLAFAVPLVVQDEGMAVRGRPRPIRLPLVPELRVPGPRPVRAEVSQAASRLARQAVAALVAADSAALARLGAGRAPLTHGLPSGWRATRIGNVEVTAVPGGLTAQVTIRARPPAGQASYVVPVRVDLEAGAQGIAVRAVNAGGPA